MRKKNSYLCFNIFFLILISYGCIKEADNTAISSDGVRISFETQGEGEPALVFVHGWSNDRTIWRDQIDHFSEKYKVVAIDLPGFGKSGNNRQQWTMESFGEDVAAVINELNLDQVVLVGFSMGGPVVIESAEKKPERIAGIVLVDALQNIEMKQPPDMLSYIDSVFMDIVTNPTQEKMVAGGFIKKNPKASFQRIRTMLDGASKTGWRESLHETFRWQNEDCISSLKQIQAPVISINADRMPTNGEAFRKYVPSFKAKIIPDVGHVVMWDAPEEFNRLLEKSIQEFMSNE